MKKYIDADKLIAEIEWWRDKAKERYNENTYSMGRCDALAEFRNYIVSFLEEQPEVDLEKLGEIARHLIAVKDHEEDMRLDEGEWLLLERIGYPERFNARKEE